MSSISSTFARRTRPCRSLVPTATATHRRRKATFRRERAISRRTISRRRFRSPRVGISGCSSPAAAPTETSRPATRSWTSQNSSGFRRSRSAEAATSAIRRFICAARSSKAATFEVLPRSSRAATKARRARAASTAASGSAPTAPAVLPTRCSPIDQGCVTTADCCPPAQGQRGTIECIAGFCAFKPPTVPR